MPDEITTSSQPAASEPPVSAPVSGNDPFAGSPAPDWTVEAGVKHVDTPPGQQIQSSPPGQQTQAVPPSQPTAAPTAITPEAIAAAVKAGIGPLVDRMPQPQAQPQKQFTQEEIDAQLGVVKVTEADYEELFGVKPDRPERVAKLNNMFQAAVKQAVTTALLANENSLSQFRDSLNPYIATIRTQEAERQKASFFTEFGDLKGYEPLVEQVYQNALAQGRKFPDVAGARKFVAETTRGLLKQIGVTPKTGAAVTAPQPQGTTPSPNTSTRQMTTTSVGGRTGGTGGTQPKSTVDAVWG